MNKNHEVPAAAMIIVTDSGFTIDDLPEAFAAGRYGEVNARQLDALNCDADHTIGLTLNIDDSLDALKPYLHLIDIIKVPFASSADGRGFSIAIALRRAGFAGRLRAVGHVIVDQYAHARRCGFDEVAISNALATRQPEPQWLNEVPKINQTYQIRLQQADRAA